MFVDGVVGMWNEKLGKLLEAQFCDLQAVSFRKRGGKQRRSASHDSGFFLLGAAETIGTRHGHSQDYQQSRHRFVPAGRGNMLEEPAGQQDVRTNGSGRQGDQTAAFRTGTIGGRGLAQI
ncbi:hypothetical protein RRG08_058406 [Elysia crispata]|uniref:Uncharacterized protein n=1 Tax=Elysia crispata TaxID=231223 RepID=A0AAE0XWL9_9GAST|nr:hypothetical protein RRG08_058406 [Elysia crispata]